MSTTERPSLLQLGEHVGQPMDRLRPEHEVDERRALA